MARNIRRRVLFACLLAVAAGCASDGGFSPSEDSAANKAWSAMSDYELAVEVARANGRVSIGFKEADASVGVDDRGRVLVSPETVAAGKAFVRSLGVEVFMEFTNIPSIGVQMRPELVPRIRRNPTIAYIEPIFPGTRASE